MRRRETFVFFSALSLATTLAGCSSGPTRVRCASSDECRGAAACVDGRCVPSATDGGMAADAGSTADAGGLRDAGRIADAAPVPVDAQCAAVEPMGREVRRPVDVIVLPDESGSMGPARDAVAAAMQTIFRTTMEAAGIDYLVVWHGATPLPALDGHLVYNRVSLGSGDGAMFTPVLDSYDAWVPSLRPGALEVFVHFTDAASGTGARINGYAGTFDAVLTARDPARWGTPDAPSFTYHAFVGLPLNTPPEAPYEPSAPVLSGSCSSRFDNPVALQEMARRTEGLRFPLCRPDLFGAVFQRIAESAIARAAVPCELELPPPPAGSTLDLATVAVRFRDDAGTDEVLLRIDDPAACTDGGFLLDEATQRVSLCPAACARVEAAPGATLRVLSGCDPMLY